MKKKKAIAVEEEYSDRVLIELTRAEKLLIYDLLQKEAKRQHAYHDKLALKLLTDYRQIPSNHAVEIIPEHAEAPTQAEIEKEYK